MNKRMKEMRSMGEAQLNERLSQLRMELVKFNTQVATGTAPKSPGLIRQAKKNIARIMTLLHDLQTKKTAANPSTDNKSKENKKGGVEKKQ
jgi:large subunit ribosomal protein L29